MISRIRNSDTQSLIAVAFLAVLIIFAAAKMAGAITGNEERPPEYKSQPPTEFSPAVVDTIVDTQYMGKTRLPDDDYDSLMEIGDQFTGSIAGLKPSKTALTRSGMSQSAINDLLNTFHNEEGFLKGRTLSVDKNYSIDGVSVIGDNLSATLTAQVQYGQAPDGSPGTAGAISYSVTKTGNEPWRIVAIDFSLTDGGS